ncbi:MAG: hypothetical protein H6807_01765 [Planctomycetes bacterium]|nr:hypothetical protein [Planctomycetota bacterium]
MFQRVILLATALFLLLPGTLAADEVKLKNGEVIKDCKVKSKRGGKVTVELLDGSRQILREDEIDSIVEKPTIADEIEARLKKLGKKDVEGMLALAREAKEKGALALVKDIGRQIVRVDKGNVEAHELMDEVLCDDGKWRGGRALEKYKVEAEESALKARGYKKINGEWVDPLTAANLEAGLELYEGQWYPVAYVNKLKAGMIWVEGQWYDGADKAKLDQGMRKYEGNWAKIEDIDAKLKAAGQPWVIESQHFVIGGELRHATLTGLLATAEKLWDPMAAFFGSVPNTAKDGKIKIVVVKDAALYGIAAEKNGGDDRIAVQSSNIPGYYSPATGAVLTYYHNIEYTSLWLQNGVACAFMAKVYGYEHVPSPAYEALASYFTGHVGGKFVMYNMMVENGIRHWKGDMDPVAAINGYDNSHKEPNPSIREATLNRMGFVLHFLAEKQPAALQAWVELLRKKGSAADFKKVISGAFADEAHKKEFQGFVAQFNANYRAPM